MRQRSGHPAAADNISGPLWDSAAGQRSDKRLVIEYPGPPGQCQAMTRLLFLTTALALASTVANAACFADYKAKRDDPLRLHYGVAEIRGDCAPGPAAEELQPRLDAAGWELLNIVSVFGDEGLEERKDSAGEFHLRF